MQQLLQILERLKQSYPQCEINLWTKADRGKIIVDGHEFIKFNCDMLLHQLASNNAAEVADDTFRYFAKIIETKYLQRKSQFAKSKGHPPANLTEAQIQFAIANTKSCMAAARFLGVHVNTYKKYAVQYNLYYSHKNQTGIGIEKGLKNRFIPMQDIFDNKHPNYHVTILRRRLVNERYLEEKCELCGYSEKRIIDGQIALVVDWKDGNQKNFAQSNLRLICYNCAFNVRGRVNIKQSKFLEKEYDTLKEVRADVEHPEVFDELFDKFQKK